jgi:uncharacterized membrane protein YeiB
MSYYGSAIATIAAYGMMSISYYLGKNIICSLKKKGLSLAIHTSRIILWFQRIIMLESVY